MVTIKILDITQQCYNNHDGELIKNTLLSYLKSHEPVTISFDGVNGLNSSFVNSAFIELLSEFSFEFIKSHLKFINGNKQIYDIIKKRFDFEVNNKAS